jgi:hypothetical protein
LLAFLGADLAGGVGDVGLLVLEGGEAGAGAAAGHLDFGVRILLHEHLGPLLTEDDHGVGPFDGDISGEGGGGGEQERGERACDGDGTMRLHGSWRFPDFGHALGRRSIGTMSDCDERVSEGWHGCVDCVTKWQAGMRNAAKHAL